MEEYRYLLAALVMLPLFAVSLRFRGFQKTEQMIARACLGRSRIADRHPQKIAHAVSVAANHGLFRVQCLVQAVTLYWFLGRSGYSSTIRFGCYPGELQPGAHAWVVFEDEVLIGDAKDLAEFKTLMDVSLSPQV